MIKITLATLAMLSAGLAVGAESSNPLFLSKGTQELNVQGLVDFNAEDSYSVDLNAKYGYFIRDGWEVGTNVTTDLSKSFKSGGVGIFTEYNFVNSTQLVPYVGVGTELVRANYNSRDDKLNTDSFNATAVNFKTSLGLKYFISKNVALTSEVNYNIATDHLKVSGDDAKKSFTKFLIGTSFYF